MKRIWMAAIAAVLCCLVATNALGTALGDELVELDGDDFHEIVAQDSSLGAVGTESEVNDSPEILSENAKSDDISVELDGDGIAEIVVGLVNPEQGEFDVTLAEPDTVASNLMGIPTGVEDVIDHGGLTYFYYPEIEGLECAGFTDVNEYFTEDIVIPAEVEGYPVVRIGYNAFNPLVVGNYGDFFPYVKSVSIPNSVTEIRSKAFMDQHLQQVTIPGSVQSIGDWVFSQCSQLKSVVIQEGVIQTGMGMFQDCGSLESVSLPNSLRLIEDVTFAFCSSLKSIEIPDNVTALGTEYGSVFYYCTSLESIVVPDGVQFALNAFSGCAALKRVSLGKGLKTISEYMFNGCTGLEEMDIREGIESIDESAFHSCISLRDITIPASVTSIGGFTKNNNNLRDSWIFSDEHQHEAKDKLTIHGKKESCAESYAKAWGIRFDSGVIEPTGIRITNGKTAKLILGDKLTLKAELEPVDAKSDITWASSDEKVAKVNDKGEVTAIGKGTVKITATTENGKTAVLKLTVGAPKPTKVKLNKTKATLTKGKQLTLKVKLYPSKAESKLKWTSSNKKVAKVSGKGNVTALSVGNATITVTTENGKSAKLKLTVTAPKPTSVKLNKKKVTLKAGKKLTLKATLVPADAQSKLTWTTSNKKVATVSKGGVIKAVKAGTAKITVTTGNGKTASVKVIVK